MALRPAGAHGRRDPVNELYDCACDLLHATHEFRSAAGRAGSAPALAATLGCIEGSLDALCQSMDNLRALAVEQLSGTGLAPAVTMALVSANLDAVRQRLDDATRATGIARATIGPLIAERCPD
jgi:hypothetical protein